jgi:hypothetical protein
MRRRSFWLALALLAVIVGTLLTTLALLAWHEPAFYARAAVPPGKERHEMAMLFEGKATTLGSAIRNGGHPETGVWGGLFSDTEINSYFAENANLTERLLPEDFTEPRICIEQDRIRLGFRYGSGWWSSIISVEFRLWLAQAEPNVLVLELLGLYAGALPISAQSILDDISEALRRQNIEVSWYRHQGNPTAALKFQSDQPRPSAQLRQVRLQPGQVTIAGQSTEPLTGQPMVLVPRKN